MVATPDELVPGTLAGEYQIEAKIGEGGMGMVYRAVHPMIGKRAAIKVIHRELSASDDAVDRFIREAQSVNRIGDPNIVDVFGFGRLHDGRSFIVMEWLQGESLRERMQRPPLPIGEVLDILETIASALAAAHAAGVVHRDLKPDNVFLVQGRGVKLLDFGLAKLHGKSEPGFSRTRTGAVMGTPLYISPEQAKGVAVTPACDLYSLGVMAYEMCASVVPFNAGSAVEIMAMHISAQPVPLGELAPWTPPELAALVHAMLAKEPAERPTLDTIREQLAACKRLPERASVPQLARSTAMASSPTLHAVPRRRRGVGAIVGAIAVVGAATGAYVLWARDTSQAPPPTPAPAKPAPVATAPTPTPTPPPPTPTPAPPPTPTPTPPPPPAEEVHAAVKPRVGTLVVAIGDGTNAQISVDGKPVGRHARMTLELPAGDHDVRAEAPRHKPADGKVHVDAGKRRTLTLVLEPVVDVNAVHDPFKD